MEQNTEALRNDFRFDGKPGELFKIYIVNIFLTIVTLGVYQFWAQVRITRFIYEHTEFHGARFGYHATGKEKFIGFLKALMIFAAVGGFLYGLYFVLTRVANIDSEIAQTISIFTFYLLFIGIFPLLRVARERFRLSRSSWRGVRFRFRGPVGELYSEFLKGGLLTLITFGFYFPWFKIRLHRYFLENSGYGNQNFGFDGVGKELFMIYLKGILLIFATCSIYHSWLTANVHNYLWNHTSVQGKKFESRVQGGELFIVRIATPMIIIMTLTLGMPLIIHLLMNAYINKLSFLGEIDLTVIEAQPDKGASALADGLSEAADAVGDILGG